MSQFTFLNDKDFEWIQNQYAIDSILSNEILTGGSENTNYLLTTERGKYVLTICEQKNHREAINLVLLLEHLTAYNLDTSIVIRNTHGKPVVIWNDKPIILKKYIEGHIVKNLSSHLMSLVGQELGKLHKIPTPEYIQNDLPYGYPHFEDVKLYSSDTKFYNWLIEIKNITMEYINSGLPKCLIHSDLFHSNIIVSKDNQSIQIMDYEEACHYFRIFDLGMTIIGSCSSDSMADLEKVRYLLKGYQKEIILTDIEKEALQPFTVYAATSMSFWRHKNFNFTNPIPGMENHYIELMKLAEFIRKIPKDEFDLKVF